MRPWIAMVLCLAAGGGCKQGRAAAQDSKEIQGGESPQEVFDKAKAAAVKDDWKTILTLLAPEERDETVMGMILGIGFMAMNDKDAEKEAQDILKKHGLDTGDGKKEQVPMGDKEKFRKYAAEKLKDVKDKPALCGELMAFMKRHDKDRRGAPGFAADKAILKDLKIDGDRAAATVDSGDGKTEPQKFVKRDGRWYFSFERESGADPEAARQQARDQAVILAAFEAAKAAAEKDDWKPYFNLLDPPDRDVALLKAVKTAGAVAANDKAAQKDLDALIEKHGVKDRKDRDPDLDLSRKESVRKKAKEEFKSAKDKGGLYTELMAFAVKHGKDAKEPAPRGRTLKNLKVEGDKAGAMMADSNSLNTMLHFVKKKDRWYLIVD